jgi:uroporphyrin-III C-methyltransferase
VAPDNGELHYGLRWRVEEGSVQWVRREFRDEDLTTLGREEVGGVVELVWVVVGSKDSNFFNLPSPLPWA